jgi:ABC-type nitrate/sulfonate/bicarbonate transport system permease component
MDRSLYLKAQGLRIVAISGLVLAWLYSTGPGGVSPLVLPPLSKVLVALWGFLGSWELYENLLVTLGTIVISLLIAGVGGFIIGFWGARTDARAGVLEPLLVWGYLVPHILFYPLLILWFGIGVPSKIAYSASSAILPIAFNCLRGFRMIDPKYVSVGRAYGASNRQMDWQIKLRAGIPMAAAGLRLGTALALITVIVAEMLASNKGLGYLLKRNAQSFNTARSFAITLATLMLVGLILFIINRVIPAPAENRR